MAFTQVSYASGVKIQTFENHVSVDGVHIPKPVWKLLLKGERLLAINKYRKMNKVALGVAVETITPIYNSITE
jgi:hypothetical protein